MILPELLASRGLTTALIVDDAYDEVPCANDLVSEGDAWANFFADIGEDDRAILAGAFPNYDRILASDLQRSDPFVATVWGLRGTLTPALWDPLFERYIRDHGADRAYLTRLEDAVRAVGITPITAGRTIPDEARQVPLAFIDLFLGSSQSNADIETSVQRVRELLKGRESAPPLIVLMSRSDRLPAKKGEFRDRAGLLGAMFRVHGKLPLLDGTTLERTLERLARHRDDALRLAVFLRSWDTGLEAAKARFLTAIRRLDLADYSHIQNLLLDFEGQPLGSYLLDVFDHLLQHEIEGNPETIRSAGGLNEIDTDRYPPPYVDGSPDLQDLVYRCLYQNPERLNVRATEGGAPVSFGDLLVSRHVVDQTPAPLDTPVDEVLMVITPACDLARPGATSVLFLTGTLKDLTPANWSYRATPIKTPILKLPGERRAWIRWDLKRLRTIELTNLITALGDQGAYRVLVRLRENQALELQQKVLADLGRVGLIAPMPGTFPVRVEIGFADTAGTLQRMPLVTVEAEGGVCFIGRDQQSNPETRLVLSETACDEILAAVAAINVATIHERGRETLGRLKASTFFASALECGIAAPPPDKTAWIPLKISAQDAQGQAVEQTLGLIGRNPSTVPVNQELRNAGFVVTIRDVHLQDAVAVTAAEAARASEAQP